MRPPTFEPVNEVPLQPRPGVDPKIHRYGRYDPDSREYLIERPDTPQPWHNYITNGEFTGYVSQTGGGTCYYRDPVERRILRTHLHGRPVDQPGRWVYIRDRKTGAYHSATWAPVHTPLEDYSYRCRVGIGYSVLEAECNGIASSLTYFVPPDADAEIWLLELTNTGKSSRRLDIFPYAEFFYWSLARDNNLDAGFKCTDIQHHGRAIIHRSYYDWGPERGSWQRQFAVFASSEDPADVDTNIDAFVGIHRGYDRPLAVENGRCSNFVNRGGKPVAAMRLGVNLRAGQTKRLAFIVGYGKDDAACKRLAKRAADVDFADAQLTKLKKQWEGFLSACQAQTPDPTLDVPFNSFSPYQNAITFICSRAISPYQLTGNRGLGYRDSTQDTLGVMPYQDPAKTKALLKTLLGVQKTSGEASHNFFPGLGYGVGGGCWDDHLWPCLAAEWYVKETGDLGFLDEEVGFNDSDRKATVMEHLALALKFTHTNRGAHGLPLLGEADWNDCLNAPHGAESLFTAGLYCAALQSCRELYDVRGEKAKARRCAQRHSEQVDLVNNHAWDGKWYIRMLSRDGTPVGSRKNKQGKIWIESNVWLVIGGAAPEDRARTALDSLRKHLCTPYGYRICWPGYDGDYDPEIGNVTIFPPGYKENASNFQHTNPWLVVAETLLGRGKIAWDAFARISPYTKDSIQDVHCAEPYAVSSMVVMPPNLEAGRAKNPWLTGFASWLLAAMGRYILGVRPEFDGLRIDPCIPGWKEFSLQRRFRGVTYDIHIRNPKGLERGVTELLVDGERVEGNIIPLPKKKRGTVRVEATMG